MIQSKETRKEGQFLLWRGKYVVYVNDVNNAIRLKSLCKSLTPTLPFPLTQLVLLFTPWWLKRTGFKWPIFRYKILFFTGDNAQYYFTFYLKMLRNPILNRIITFFNFLKICPLLKWMPKGKCKNVSMSTEVSKKCIYL